MDHDALSSLEPQVAGDLEAMVARARVGDREVLPLFREYLDNHPEAWQGPGDLARHAMDMWINLIAGLDLASREALTRKAAAIGSELAGESPSSLEKLLVERVVACWLQVHYSDAAVTQIDDVSLRQAVFAQKRQDAAHRRYLSAIGALAMVRRLIPAAVEPAGFLSPCDPMTDPTDAALSMANLGGPDRNLGDDPGRPAPLMVFDSPSGGSRPGGRNGRPSRKRMTTAS